MDTATVSRRCVSVLAVVMFASTAPACGSGDNPSPTTADSAQTAQFEGQQAREWVDEVLELIEEDALSPPVASRTLGYTGLAIYEATVDGMPDHDSFGNQIGKLQPPPSPDTDEGYDPPTVMHSTLGHLAPLLFDNEKSQQHLKEFAERALERRLEQIDGVTWSQSANRGILIAEVVSSRMSSDGYYARTNAEFIPPLTGEGTWEPTGDEETPLEPNWALLEPFTLEEADDCRPAPPVEFSTAPDSEFFAQAQAVYEATPTPGSSEEAIARFWADDPGDTPTPAGHWMALAGQLIEERSLDLERAARLYALLGIAAADAFISCWDEKYRSYLVRPVTYIRDHIDPQWDTAIDTPPFPEYTSGHANVSGAAARVLGAMFDDESFENRVHEHRGKPPRSYDSFEEAAEEAGLSRVYGGVHYPMANEEGLDQGRCVAGQVLDELNAE